MFLLINILAFLAIFVDRTSSIRSYQCSNASSFDQITCAINNFQPGSEAYSFVERRAHGIRRLIFTNAKHHEIPPPVFNVFKNVELLMMNNSGIDRIDPRNIGDASTLKQLILPENKITQLRDESFKDAPNLEVIDLSKNLIKDVGRAALKGINELRTLNLEGNQIVNLPLDVFNYATKLYRIDLSANRLETLDSNIFYPCKYLRELILKNNQLTEFRAVLEYNTLNKVILNQNKLKLFSLDTEKQRVSNISLTIQAIDNQIESFFLSEKFKVTALHLYKNNLKSYDLIFSLSSLKSLSLSSNNLGLVDRETFRNLGRLEELYLSRCNLFLSDPDTFRTLKRLKKLDIGYNSLRFMNFMDLRQMTNLEILAIHSNLLSDIDVHALKISLPNLKKIMITGNDFLCSTLDRIFDQLERANIEPAVDFKTLKRAERAQIHCTPKLDVDTELERISERLNYVEGKLNIAVEAIERRMIDQIEILSDKFCTLERILPTKVDKSLRQDSLCDY